HLDVALRDDRRERREPCRRREDRESLRSDGVAGPRLARAAQGACGAIAIESRAIRSAAARGALSHDRGTATVHRRFAPVPARACCASLTLTAIGIRALLP